MAKKNVLNVRDQVSDTFLTVSLLFQLCDSPEAVLSDTLVP